MFLSMHDEGYIVDNTYNYRVITVDNNYIYRVMIVFNLMPIVRFTLRNIKKYLHKTLLIFCNLL